MLLAKIQQWFNAMLREDDRTRTAACQLAGKTIALHLRDTQLTIYVQFGEEGVMLSTAPELKPQVTITAQPFIFLSLLLDRDGTSGITPDLEVSGDTTLAQRFQDLLRAVEPDWEEQLARRIGDFPAHQAARLFGATRAYVRDVRRNLGINLSEYLRYETEILPTRHDVEDFITAVGVVRDDVERLRQRLDRLRGQLA